MGTRRNDQETPRQPLLSSLVVRPSVSGEGVGSDRAGVGADYESDEVHRHGHHDRYDPRGRKLQADSFSPTHHRDPINRVSPGLERTVSSPLNHEFDNGRDSGNRRFGSGRDSGRYRDFSPSYNRGRDSGFDRRPYVRSSRVPGPARGEGPSRNNPNVRPREGDWICTDPSCNNLNFARRERCNNCSRPRFASSMSPKRGGYSGNPSVPRHHVPSPVFDSSPRRIPNGRYHSPPPSWQRDILPRDFRPTGHPNRHEGRFHPGADPRNRYGYDRPLPGGWTHTSRRSDNYYNDRREYGGRLSSPSHDWPYIRNRSRSPVRGGPPPKKYRHDVYMDQWHEDRRVIRRDAL